MHPQIVSDSGRDITSVGDPGTATATALPASGPSASPADSALEGSPRPVARAAGLGGFPDPTVAGAGWLAVVGLLSIAVTVVRRRRVRRGLDARIAARLAAIGGPRPLP